MIGALYDVFLCLVGIFLFPKWLSKRHKLPQVVLKSKVIWLHAVSVGEMRAAAPLFYALRTQYPDASILISCITTTGLEEAKRSMPHADMHFFLPWDISWIIRPLVRKLRPDLLILVEGDFWYQLVRSVKNRGGKVALVSGKISERSARRWSKVVRFSHMLFSQIDIFCVQSLCFQKRFLCMGVDPAKIKITGNLKLDVEPCLLLSKEKETWRKRLGIADRQPVIVIGSTHDPEERLLLSALFTFLPKVKILIAPRHPERFEIVARTLERLGLSFTRFSENKADAASVMLVDTMGVLSTCYQLADIAIVGGSFCYHLQGHNIFEPVSYGTPVIFGPYMKAQLDLVDLILTASAGESVSIDTLVPMVAAWLSSGTLLEQKKQAARACAAAAKGATKKTLAALNSCYEKKEKRAEGL